MSADDETTSSSPPGRQPFFFSGFHFPNYTPVPDQVFDELLSMLSGAELKVLLYICRRTFGFKKESDNISLNQLLYGLVKKDGTRLDAGTGLSKPTLLKTLRDLQEKGVIEATRRCSDERGDEPTNYRLRFTDGRNTPAVQRPLQQEEGGRSKNFTTGGKETLPRGRSKKLTRPVVKKPTSQETVVQKTVAQETDVARAHQNNNNGTIDDKHNVVVALTNHGISQTVAHQLANHYSREHIEEKLAYLVFLQEEQPEIVQKPRGWLRRAIEEDYGPPDGYRSATEREQQAVEEAAQEEAWLQLEQQQQAFTDRLAAQQAAFRQRLTEQYGTTAADEQFWQEVLLDFKHGQPDLYHLFASAQILSTDDERVRLGFTHELSMLRLTHPGTQTALKRTLKRIAKRPLEVETVLLNEAALDCTGEELT